MYRCVSVGSGAYVASEKHQVAYSRSLVDKRGLIFHGGVGQTAVGAPNAGTWLVTDDSIPVITADFSNGATWGNATGVTRVGQVWTYFKSTWAAKTDKVILYGSSMGGCVVLNWAKANPSSVAAIALTIPAVDIQDIYDNDRGGYQASVSTAHGGRPSDANTPAKNAASFAGIPILLYYASDDPICVPAAATAFAATAGATTVNMGAVGHTPPSSPSFYHDIAAFLAQYA